MMTAEADAPPTDGVDDEEFEPGQVGGKSTPPTARSSTRPGGLTARVPGRLEAEHRKAEERRVGEHAEQGHVHAEELAVGAELHRFAAAGAADQRPDDTRA